MVESTSAAPTARGICIFASRPKHENTIAALILSTALCTAGSTSQEIRGHARLSTDYSREENKVMVGAMPRFKATSPTREGLLFQQHHHHLSVT